MAGCRTGQLSLSRRYEGGMARNKKRNASKARQAVLSDEAQEELLALAAIFEEHFTADEDGRGFQLAVNPHPGDVAANLVSATLRCRWAPALQTANLCCST